MTDLAAHAQADPGWARGMGALIRTTNVNDATVELLGAAGRPAVLGPLDRYLPAEDPAMLQVLLALWEKRDRFEGRAQLIAADGRTLTVLLGISFPDDCVGFDQVVVGVVDITQRERTQEALLAAQAELARAARAATLGALSASIAHELNQPLGAIVLNAQACLRWLRRDQPDIETAAKAADRIVRDGRRAADIVQRTRGMLVKDTHCDETIDLAQLVDEVALLLERELSGAGAVLVTDFAPVPPVRGSRVGLQQVLVNLVTNGLHAMAEADSPRRELTVAIGSLEGGAQVRVAVRDRGRGIDEASHARLFDPFFTTRSDGMGMGLAICRSTIESCGGTLTAHNHADGGAVFEFTIPVAPPAVHQIIGRTASRPAGRGTRGLTAMAQKAAPSPEPAAALAKDDPLVLIVDDDAGMREAVVDLLQSVGIEGRAFGSTAELLAAAVPDRLGCLILDVRLPGLGGLEFQTRLDSLGIALPIVFMTGFADVPMSVRAMKAGATDFLIKPFRDQDMLDAVDAAIARDRLRRSQRAATMTVESLAATLTPREREVMAEVVKGRLNKQIAGDLGISEVTVKLHRGKVMRKMQVRSVADLVRKVEVLDHEE
ncbi:response regulator [Azospirillum melinis]|uniref:response regulator n=1 Tax=Azospirillum melinis TaxID=328839 RepID=UPI003756531C